MTYTAFLSAVLALLLAPGPTNTLMGLAGAKGGLRSVGHLLHAELLGYLTTILPLIWLGSAVLERFPFAALGLKAVAAVWVMFLAVQLWDRNAGSEDEDTVSPRRVYVTTVLNPKALIFGLVLLPAPSAPDFAGKLGLFALMVLGVALLWGMAGASIRLHATGTNRLQVVRRVASGWLALVSITLIAGVLRT